MFKQEQVPTLSNSVSLEEQQNTVEILEKKDLDPKAPTEVATDIRQLSGQAHDKIDNVLNDNIIGESKKTLEDKSKDSVFRELYGMERNDSTKEKIFSIVNRDMPLTSSMNILSENTFKRSKEPEYIRIIWKDQKNKDNKANIDSLLLWYADTKKLVIESIRASQRQEGFGRIASRNIIDLARAIGAENVELLAGEENGPYFWARMGFLPHSEAMNVTKGMHGLDGEFYFGKKGVQEFLQGSLKYFKDIIPIEDYTQLQDSLANKEDGSWLWDIVDSQVPISIYGKTMALNKIFSIPKYHGIFSLDNPEQARRLEEYTRPKQKTA